MDNFKKKHEDSLVEVFYESIDENGHKHYGVEKFDTASCKALSNAQQSLLQPSKKT